jgi:glycosyltransferase involved in cell wall biosynthesis
MTGKRLCLNMIVKNEMANLERCLASVAEHIACWVIGDTGSTDGTQDFIKAFFARRGLPGELHSFPFHNFEQARNAALVFAEATPLDYDYLLLDDADMELVVEDRDFRARLEAPGYRLLQRTDSGLSYANTRLAQRKIGVRYHGVTHEYLDVPGGVQDLTGVWYKDHASGSNRVDKFERDIRLLSKALKKEPDNHRYWFYLAQSYRDAGRTAEAAKTYAKRAEMGGWDEEAWYARLSAARCLRTLGDDGGFLREAIAAFNQRPQRAEPLYDLARFYRDRGMNDASLLFSEPGVDVPRPDDILFLEDFVYTTGLQEEYSIAANYASDPIRRDRGHAACNWLALTRDVPVGSRDLAWSNLYFYVEPADRMMPSFAARPIGFAAPEGYRVLNPSVVRRGEQIFLVQRTVNYTLTEDGLRYQTADNAPIQTRNFLLRLSPELEIESSGEILPPADMPPPAYGLVIGFEDMRPFLWPGELWCSACNRELTPEGWCEQLLARIDTTATDSYRLTNWRVLRPQGPRVHEKNWMPQVVGDKLQFVYLCDPARLVDDKARTIAQTTPAIAAPSFRGGSQLIAFDGGWLALIHEVQWKAAMGRRFYQHRFIWFDQAGVLRGVSRQFYFQSKGIEFAAGLAWHPDGERLLISYSVADAEAWIATVDSDDIRRMLEDVSRLRSARSETGEQGAPDPLLWHLPQGSAGDLPTATAMPAAEAVETKAEEEDRAAMQGRDEAAPRRVGADEDRSIQEVFSSLAPFLAAADSPEERRRLSQPFDARIAPLLSFDGAAALPQIHCFYQVLSDTGEHQDLTAAVASMRAAGHPVRVWTYSPEKLKFLVPYGVELRAAEDVLSRNLFDRIVAGSEIRYFSDIFRYAALYEHGGLWMDSDVIMLRPFPFRGDHFFNLQWRGGNVGHFICGNVIYARQHSRHLRNLYEMSIDRFFGSSERTFGEVGPLLLSNYVASPAGAELRDRLFSPLFFNPIDWTEVGRFDRPIADLADYLNDERVFGVHLWNARTHLRPEAGEASLISLLSDPLGSYPSLTSLADRFDTDKNRITGNRHAYARVYDRLLASRRFSLRRLMEIGLCRGLAEGNQRAIPSVDLWQSFFPFCHIVGVDLTDFSRFNGERFTSLVADQSNLEALRSVAAEIEPGSLDVIVDDGSHASFDQQLTMREFFPLLADGGWYFIEDLDWQPPGEDAGRIALTKTLLKEIQLEGKARSIDPLGISVLSGQIDEILFFDSHYELERARLMGGLAAIRKRGGSGLVG